MVGAVVAVAVGAGLGARWAPVTDAAPAPQPARVTAMSRQMSTQVTSVARVAKGVQVAQVTWVTGMASTQCSDRFMMILPHCRMCGCAGAHWAGAVRCTNSRIEDRSAGPLVPAKR